MEKINIPKEDPLTTLWGIYNSGIGASTGATDSEFNAFQELENKLRNKKISAEEAITRATNIVEARQDYH